MAVLELNKTVNIVLLKYMMMFSVKTILRAIGIFSVNTDGIQYKLSENTYYRPTGKRRQRTRVQTRNNKRITSILTWLYSNQRNKQDTCI